MDLNQSWGTIRYSEFPLLKVVLEIDPEIVRYARRLLPKYIDLAPQMHLAHISIVRKEMPPKMEHWRKYEGETVDFLYSNEIWKSETYGWINAFSPKMEEIRLELGLPLWESDDCPQGTKHRFHITIGNAKSSKN